jgi:hypothetical protein
MAYSEPEPSLLQNMQLVMNASPEALEKTVRVRPPKDRQEIEKILGNLPMVQDRQGVVHHSDEIRESRAQTAASKASSHPDGRAFTPRSPTEVLGAAGVSGVASPRTRRSPTARAGSSLMKVAGSTQAPTLPDTIPSYLFGGHKPLFLEDSARREATQRVQSQLAEIGITDPAAKDPGRVLHTLYARESPTAYRIMSQEAEKGFSAESKVPQIFSRVLTPRAQEERRCLDARGTDALADVCRTVRHYGDKKDYSSEYMHMYSPRVNGANLPRKSYKRRTDL